MHFKELNIIPEILKALEKSDYISPTPIQEQAITPILSGRDLLGCAQTGTGKTAAFAVPILQILSEANKINASRRNIQALVLSPTRELALQILESFRTYGQYTNLQYGVIFGGVSQKPQEQILKMGIDILVATPGRLLDLINQKLIDLRYIRILVLDEADHMLDMGFINDVKKIVTKVPLEKQTLLFSATMPTEISKMANSILVNPVKIAISPISSTVEIIEQLVYFVDKQNKQKLLLHVLKDQSITSALIFTRTKHGADRVVRELTRANIKAQAIHGNKSQNARQLALENFKNKVTRVLVATDIASRGIDIDELSHVINFELPNIPETYIHRIGRTGRAEHDGIAISFCDFDEKAYLSSIEKLMNKHITEMKEHPFPMLINIATPKNTTQRQKPLGTADINNARRTKTSNRRKTEQKHIDKKANHGEKETITKKKNSFYQKG